MKKFLSIVLAALFAGSALAQITVNSGDAPEIGLTTTNYSTIDNVTWSPGSGSNQTWNIGSFNFTEDGVSQYVSPSSTPYASTFPNATHCQTVDNSTWTYFRVANNGMYFQGFATQVDTFEFVQVPDEESLLLPFPCTMGTSWTSVMRITIEPFPGFESTTVDSSIYTVDGWGTLTTPVWTEPALRGMTHGYSTSYLNGVPIGETTEDWTYMWITENAARTAGYSNFEATGPDFTTGDVVYSHEGTIDVDPIRGPLAENFKLSQNYPNPFNPTTNLPLDLAKSSKIEMTIYNETGQVVQHMSYDLGAGHHELPIDGSAWSTGSYFAKVMAGNEVQTTRMVLVK